MSVTKLDFEMTPELQEIIDREPGMMLHPTMKSDTKLEDWMVIYDSSMELPEINDKEGILKWLGINEAVSKSTLEQYEKGIANNPKRLGEEGPDLVQNLCDEFLHGIASEWHGDDAEGFGMKSSHLAHVKQSYPLTLGK